MRHFADALTACTQAIGDCYFSFFLVFFSLFFPSPLQKLTAILTRPISFEATRTSTVPSSLFHHMIISFFLLAGSYEEAVRDMQRAVELNGQSGEAQEGLRRAQRQLKLSQRLDYYKARIYILLLLLLIKFSNRFLVLAERQRRRRSRRHIAPSPLNGIQTSTKKVDCDIYFFSRQNSPTPQIVVFPK